VREAQLRNRLADKLFKVWRKQGTEAWLLVHVEIQGRAERDFPERMYVYNYRIYDRYNHQVASLAVLCDEQPAWRPDHFSYDNWGCEVGIRFPMVKVIDYRQDEASLERSANPFASVILAQLKVLETKREPATRWQWKLRLVKGLYDRGLNREQVRQLFRVLDWMLALPVELEQSFRSEIERFEEERQMPYVTSIERLAREEGLTEGFQNAIVKLLEARFKKLTAKQTREVRSVHEVDRLETLLRAASDAVTLDEALSRIRGS
jgi:hypothetical protein